MRRLLGAISLIVAATAALLAAQVRPQGLVRETWNVDGVDRTALVAMPGRAAGAPLVLVFHGHGGTPAHSAKTFNIHTAWPEAMVVYAQGLPTPGRLTDPAGVRPGWQSGVGEQDDRDLRFVDAILKWAKTSHKIDERRIYAAGHSNGGTMVYVLWAARADFFAAFAPSSSIFQLKLLGAAKPKPALVIAGEEDQLVKFAGQKLSLAAMLRLNKADTTGSPWQTKAVLHKSAIGADVVAYIHPGDHTLPADAGAMMAKFFQTRELEAKVR
jgi:polyhydroxybutyrate depolymerase